jgi:hypothetical protein
MNTGRKTEICLNFELLGKHWFHFTCISKWISNSNASCPLCKSHAKASDVIHMPLEVSRGLLLSCRNLSTDNSIENDWNVDILYSPSELL